MEVYMSEEGYIMGEDGMFSRILNRVPSGAKWEGFSADGPCYSKHRWIRCNNGVWRYTFTYEVGMFDAKTSRPLEPRSVELLERAWTDHLDEWAIHAFVHYPAFEKER